MTDSAAATERRMKEAGECCQKAEEYLKTSLLKLKTKPNYDSAAYEYERAAVCYRNAARMDLCRDAHLKAADCYSAMKNLFHEAKALDAAAMAAKDAKDLAKAVELFERSAEGYLLAGSGDTAAMTIDKAAKIMEPLDVEGAIRLYEKGLGVVAHSDRAKSTISFLTRLVAIRLAREEWSVALEKLRELAAKYEEIGEPGKIGMVVMGMALVELKREDSVAALQALHLLPESNIGAYVQEMSAIKSLVRAYDTCDNEAFQRCLAGGMWRAMDNEYLRLMRTMKAPEGMGGAAGGEEEEDEEDLR